MSRQNEMQDGALSLVGRIAIAWNKVEYDSASLLRLYLGADAMTADILLRPMRSSDQETLLKKLVAAKEPDDSIKTEIVEAIKHQSVLRDNRNLIVHNLGAVDGFLSSRVLKHIEVVAEQLEAFHGYIVALKDSLEVIFIDRDSREIYADDLSDEAEERPIPIFSAPPRPAKPARLSPEDIA